MTNRIEVVSASICSDGKYFLLGKRRGGLNFPGKWETPGGKVEQGEKLSEALRRELKEELDVRAAVYGSPVFTYEYLTFPFNVHYFNVKLVEQPKCIVHEELAWLTRAGILGGYDLTPSTQAYFESLPT